MAKGDFLGEFEQIVLLAILRLGNDAYGMAVRQEIEERTGRSTSIGAVYATIERLEEKGLVSRRDGESSPERGGKAKRFFKVESAGRRALRNSQRAMEKMIEGLAI